MQDWRNMQIYRQVPGSLYNNRGRALALSAGAAVGNYAYREAKNYLPTAASHAYNYGRRLAQDTYHRLKNTVWRTHGDPTYVQRPSPPKSRGIKKYTKTYRRKRRYKKYYRRY